MPMAPGAKPVALPDRSSPEDAGPDPRARRRVGSFVRDGLIAGLIAAAINGAVIVLAAATGHQPSVAPGEPWSAGAVALSPAAAAGATVLAGLVAGALAGVVARLIRRPALAIALGGAALTTVSLIAPLQTPTDDGRAVLVACHLIAGAVITTALVRQARRDPGR